MEILNSLISNTKDIIDQQTLAQRLATRTPLKVKLGVDPTRPDLTLGHMVVFNKLRQFQELGHQALLIIGDFTALVGDPSGRSSTRPILTKKEVKENAQTYLQQAFKILDKKQTFVRYNSEWFSKMKFEQTLTLARKMTVARMLERDDFSERYKQNNPISIVEFLYPLLQGYDSLMVEADVEIGGNDQLFNLLVGRTLQKDAGKPEQVVITMPLLVGLDGTKKMSKSLDNYIAFNDSSKNIFGKVMSLNDDLMWDYYRLLLNTSDTEIKALQQKHPRQVKIALARTLTEKFYNETIAQHEKEEFERVFSQNKPPEQMPLFVWSKLTHVDTCRLIDLLGATSLFSSKKEARRIIEQGGVKIDGQKILDPNASIPCPKGEYIIQAGKRTFFKVKNK
jgi:tyrosyl-tRNA synthetase